MGEGVLRLMEAAVFFIVASNSAPAGNTQTVAEQPAVEVQKVVVQELPAPVSAPVATSAVQ